jgi:heme-degrading monooxygenase HmoA
LSAFFVVWFSHWAIGSLPAMAEQPGFISAAVVKPFADEELEALQAFKPEAAMEVVCFWRSEKERVEWVARPIHDEVFAKVMEAAASASHTLQTVERSWGVLS